MRPWLKDRLQFIGATRSTASLRRPHKQGLTAAVCVASSRMRNITKDKRLRHPIWISAANPLPHSQSHWVRDTKCMTLPLQSSFSASTTLQWGFNFPPASYFQKTSTRDVWTRFLETQAVGLRVTFCGHIFLETQAVLTLKRLQAKAWNNSTKISCSNANCRHLRWQLCTIRAQMYLMFSAMPVPPQIFLCTSTRRHVSTPALNPTLSTACRVFWCIGETHLNRCHWVRSWLVLHQATFLSILSKICRVIRLGRWNRGSHPPKGMVERHETVIGNHSPQKHPPWQPGARPFLVAILLPS